MLGEMSAALTVRVTLATSDVERAWAETAMSAEPSWGAAGEQATSGARSNGMSARSWKGCGRVKGSPRGARGSRKRRRETQRAG
jgi:hypothetical protein